MSRKNIKLCKWMNIDFNDMIVIQSKIYEQQKTNQTIQIMKKLPDELKKYILLFISEKYPLTCKCRDKHIFPNENTYNQHIKSNRHQLFIEKEKRLNMILCFIDMKKKQIQMIEKMTTDMLQSLQETNIKQLQRQIILLQNYIHD